MKRLWLVSPMVLLVVLGSLIVFSRRLVQPPVLPSSPAIAVSHGLITAAELEQPGPARPLPAR